MTAAEAVCRRHTTGPHTQPRPKPTVNIDHIGPVDDPDAGVKRSAESNAAIVTSELRRRDFYALDLRWGNIYALGVRRDMACESYELLSIYLF